MRKLVLAAVLAMACASVTFPMPAAAQGYSRAAQRVLSQARSAAGGAGWNLLRGWHETGHMGDAAYEAWLDPLRYGLRVEVQSAGVSTSTVSTVKATGKSYRPARPLPPTTRSLWPALALRRSSASMASSSPAASTPMANSSAYVRATAAPSTWSTSNPGAPTLASLWFDRRTHLLARMIDRSGPKPRTVELSDYRKVGPIRVAFRIVSDDPVDTASHDQRSLDALVFAPADRGVFSLPRPATPAPAPGDGAPRP